MADIDFCSLAVVAHLRAAVHELRVAISINAACTEPDRQQCRCPPEDGPQEIKVVWSRGSGGRQWEESLQRNGAFPDELVAEDLDPADYAYWSNERMVIAQLRAHMQNPYTCCGGDGIDCIWSLWLYDPAWACNPWQLYTAIVKDGGFPGCDLPQLGGGEQRWKASFQGKDYYIYTQTTSSDPD